MSLSACYFLSSSVSHTDCASIFPTLPPSERVHTTTFFLLSWFVRMSVCLLYPSVCVCPGNISLILLARVSAHRLAGANVRPLVFFCLSSLFSSMGISLRSHLSVYLSVCFLFLRWDSATVPESAWLPVCSFLRPGENHR